MQAGKNNLRRALRVILSACLLALMWAFWPRERPLLDQAVRVADTAAWEGVNGKLMGPPPYMTYYWSAAGKVLFFREDDTIGALLCQYDPSTGIRTPYRKLSARWSQDGTYKKQIEISPDGRWVLWQGDYWNHDFHGFYGSRLDGSHRFHFRQNGNGTDERANTWETSGVLWLNDSRRFVEIVSKIALNKTGDDHTQRLFLRSVDAPQTVRRIPSTNANLLDSGEVRFLDGFRILITKEKPPGQWPPQQYTFYETALGAGAKPLRQWICRVPSPEITHEIALSPQGDKIAWLIDTEEEVPPMLKFLHRLSAWFKLRSVRSARLCISDLDGDHMRQIRSHGRRADLGCTGIRIRAV